MSRLFSLLVLTSLGACRRESEGTPLARADVELTVFAASSLTEVFSELERDFERTHPYVDVKATFAGSQVLRLQIEQGANVDVFASADERHAEALVQAALLQPPHVFAHNELVAIVPASNPAGVRSFADMVNAHRIVLGSEAVPVGKYTRSLLERARSHLGDTFVDGVLSHVVSEEDNVRLVRAKVELGEADAAIVYRTDAQEAAAGRVAVIDIPAEYNVVADYPIGVVRRSERSELAQEFVELVLSETGRAALARHGFKAP